MYGQIKRFREYYLELTMLKKISLLTFALLIICLPILVFVVQQQQETRQRASGEKGLYFAKDNCNAPPTNELHFIQGLQSTLLICLNSSEVALSAFDIASNISSLANNATITSIEPGTDANKLTQEFIQNTNIQEGSFRVARGDMNNTLTGNNLELIRILFIPTKKGNGALTINSKDIFFTTPGQSTAIPIITFPFSYTISNQPEPSKQSPRTFLIGGNPNGSQNIGQGPTWYESEPEMCQLAGKTAADCIPDVSAYIPAGWDDLLQPYNLVGIGNRVWLRTEVVNGSRTNLINGDTWWSADPDIRSMCETAGRNSPTTCHPDIVSYYPSGWDNFSETVNLIGIGNRVWVRGETTGGAPRQTYINGATWWSADPEIQQMCRFAGLTEETCAPTISAIFPSGWDSFTEPVNVLGIGNKVWVRGPIKNGKRTYYIGGNASDNTQPGPGVLWWNADPEFASMCSWMPGKGTPETCIPNVVEVFPSGWDDFTEDVNLVGIGSKLWLRTGIRKILGASQQIQVKGTQSNTQLNLEREMQNKLNDSLNSSKNQLNIQQNNKNDIPKNSDMYIDFIIRLQGIGDKNQGNNQNPLHTTRIMSAIFENIKTKEKTEYSFPTKYSDQVFKGSLALPSTFPTGDYLITIKTDRYLSTSITSTIKKGKNMTTPFSLLIGDINNDNVINAKDYTILNSCGYGAIAPLPMSNALSAFKKTACQKNKSASFNLENVDLDDNGIVNEIDFIRFNKNFSKKGT